MATNNLQLKMTLKIRRSNELTAFEIPESNIVSCIIKEHVLSILPRIELVVTDAGNLFEFTPIIDKDVIMIYFSNGVNDGLKAEFQISNFLINSEPDSNRYAKIKIAGHLNCNDALVSFKNRSIKGNSSVVFSKIAKEMGLNFKNKSTNPPADLMTWIQYSNNYNFLKHVLKRSYVSKDCSFLYGDVSGVLNFTSLVTALNVPMKFKTVYDRRQTENIVMGATEGVLYFDAYDLSNTTDIYNDIANYGITYTETNSKASIPRTDVKFSNKNTQYNNREMNNNLAVVNHFDFGMFNDLNLYPQYNKANLQNRFNRYNLFNVNIRLRVNTSTDITLFDKVYLELPSLIEKSGSNDCYSGDYLTTGITYKIISQLPNEKEIILSRSGINKNTIPFTNIV